MSANLREITKRVYYAGVNDRVTALFEGLWPLPDGVSYNSYIVHGEEKTALIDGVRIDEVREYLSKVQLGAHKASIDYLVVNHMEPDHSGAIPELVKTYPGMKIIGNAQTVGMIKGFYHLDNDDLFVTVKDGDTIDLGGRSLQFFLTPMVHWPETMMTWLADEGVLFSGDAFGCFGALNGGVKDTEMDTGWYIPEMYRYYSNIVGKYGRFVQAALKKLGDLPVEYICSTHGPVWHERINEVIDIYDKLSAYRSEHGVTIVYGSMYGNTAEVAELIASELNKLGVRNIKIHDALRSPMSRIISDAFRYEGIIAGSATYSMRLLPPMETFLNALETREVKNKVFACFGSFTWAKGAVQGEMQKFSERMKMPITDFFAMKQTLDEETRKNAQALAQAVAAALTQK